MFVAIWRVSEGKDASLMRNKVKKRAVMNSILEIRPADECKYDQISLGEVMLRFDPGDERIHTTRSFRVWEGGGEYNVARGLRRCFGQRTAIVTAFADNPVGRLIEDFILQGGVDTSLTKWVPYDGIGRTVRNGLNFTERGFGPRGAVGCSDRGHTAASQLKPGEIDWEELFSAQGVRWFHTGGIFAALSETTAGVILEATAAARKYGTIVSYDLNYRPSLWKNIGGMERAREVNRAIAPNVDVMIGNEEDFSAALGMEMEDVDEKLVDLPVESFKKMIGRAVTAFPNFRVVATTLRSVKSASINDWGAICWSGGRFYEAPRRANLEIFDRVGGGDSFASGLIYGFLTADDAQRAVNLGAAHGALAMTTPGDTSMATLIEVEHLAAEGSARVQR
jgi:2-dehydro-3-deoxygluconokinase